MDRSSNWLERLTREHAIWSYSQGGAHAAYDMADRHSGFYFNTDVAASNPRLMHDAAIELAGRLRIPSGETERTWIASYSGSISAGLVLAAHVSFVTGLGLAYMDIRTDTLNFPIQPDDKIIIITDDIHSGGSARKLMRIVRSKGAVVSSLLTMGNFSGADALENIGITALFTANPDSWRPSDCPLCRAGSIAIHARRDWTELLAIRNTKSTE